MSTMVELASDDKDQRQRDDTSLDPTVVDLSRFLSDDLTLFRAAVSLKNQVVEMTWKREKETKCVEPMVYTGLMGTTLTCLRAYQATGCRQDLVLAANIARSCATYAHASRQVTFLCGRGGIFALGAVIANYLGDHQGCSHFLDLFLEVAQEKALPVGPEEGGFGMSYDLSCGRAGFLWAALFIRKHLGDEIIPDKLLMSIVEAILAGGRAGASDNPSCPLMYRWHGTRYWGAQNGLAGILHVLLHFPLSEEDVEDVKMTLRYMMSKRFPNSGNYPSSEGNPRDKLVQWSHGATSMALTLCKASQVFADEREFRDGAIEAAEVVWKSGLAKKVGLADGAAGNAYAFLSLYKLTKEPVYLERAKAFASFLYHNAGDLVEAGYSHETDHGYSLFLGLAGVSCLFFDLMCPEKSKFPGYEL